LGGLVHPEITPPSNFHQLRDTTATSTGAVLLVVGLAELNLSLTMTGIAIAMLSKLWLLDRMVWVYSEIGEDHPLLHQDDRKAHPGHPNSP
jgi:hypothetical protein